MGGYSEGPLRRLKSAAGATSPSIVETSANYFQIGAEMMATAQGDLAKSLAALGSAWQGEAAQAAMSSAQQVYAQMELTRATATTARAVSAEYVAQVQDAKAEMAAIDEVDTS